MVPDDLERDLPAPRRQGDPAVAGVVEEPHPLELLHHTGDRGSRDPEVDRDVPHRDLPAPTLVAQLPDRLQVVFDGVRNARHGPSVE